MRVLVLSSTFLRHHFVINTVAAALDVLGVWREEKSFKPERYALSDADHRDIAAHFARRDASEEDRFADHRALRLATATADRVGPPGFINDPVEIDRMSALGADAVLVFGTGLLRPPLIDRFEGRILNIHLGLSPYYRGSGTNFWPLVNREPELVGATIHYIDAGIDTGPIVAHARPEMAPDDGPHDIGNKALAAAASTLVAVALAHHRDHVRAVPQTGVGRLYQRKDFSADAVRRLYRNFETRMIPEYLQQREARDAALSLLTFPTA